MGGRWNGTGSSRQLKKPFLPELLVDAKEETVQLGARMKEDECSFASPP